MGMYDDYLEDGETVEDIAEAGFDVKDGAYEFLPDEVKVLDFDEDHNLAGQHAWVINLLITDADDESQIGKHFGVFLRKPNRALQGDTSKFFASNLKSTMLWFGVPEGALSQFDLDDEDHQETILNRPGHGVIKTNKKGFQNLTSYEVDEETDTPASNEHLAQMGAADPGW